MQQYPEWTVSQISFAIKQCVEQTFSDVRVRGEIFGAKCADSGHWYLSLKDDEAILAAVCWKGVAQSLKIQIEDGLEVIAKGRITTFGGRSTYQLVIEELEVAGTGALLKLLEERKQQFLKEGLFDASHKKPLPFLPQTIGVVTSASGAVIRDIIHRITDRFPTRLIVWPVPVQGEGAADKIAAAIKGFNALPLGCGIPRPDVLIVARGGGSLEDLWAFNEEVVIRAVFHSEIPVISAVGHETDSMLIDYVSDLRAPTPTGAAEFAVPVKAELKIRLMTLDQRLQNAIFRQLGEYRQLVEALSHGIPNLRQILEENRQKLDDKFERFQAAQINLFNTKKQALALAGLKPFYIQNILFNAHNRCQNIEKRLDSVSVESVLKRGFAWVTDRHFKTLYASSQAMKASELNIRFADGIVKTKIVEKRDAQQFDLFDN